MTYEWGVKVSCRPEERSLYRGPWQFEDEARDWIIVGESNGSILPGTFVIVKRSVGEWETGD
jgi:hypothetical protein